MENNDDDLIRGNSRDRDAKGMDRLGFDGQGSDDLGSAGQESAGIGSDNLGSSGIGSASLGAAMDKDRKFFYRRNSVENNSIDETTPDKVILDGRAHRLGEMGSNADDEHGQNKDNPNSAEQGVNSPPNDREKKKRARDSKFISSLILDITVKYIILLSVLLVTALVVFLIFFRPTQQVSTPNVMGKPFVDAAVILQSKNLYVKVQQQYTTDPSDIGKVIQQYPKPGVPIRAQRRVNLTISKGAVISEVPDFVGFSLDGSLELLRNEFGGLKDIIKIRSVSKIFSELPINQVLGQSPGAGSKISNNGTEVDLIVSRGEFTQKDVMFDMVGLFYTEIIDFLQENELAFEFYLAYGEKPLVTEREQYFLASGIILEQAPSASSSIKNDTVVRIGVRPAPLVQESNRRKIKEVANAVFSNFEIKIAKVPVKGMKGTITIFMTDGNETKEKQLFVVSKYQNTITFPYEEKEGLGFRAVNSAGNSFWSFSVAIKDNE